MRPSGFRKYSEVLKLNLHDSDGLDYYWNYVSREERFFSENGNNQAFFCSYLAFYAARMLKNLQKTGIRKNGMKRM